MRRPRLTYRSLEEDPSCEHPVDQAVRVRVGRRDLQRTVVDSSTVIVKTLGKRRRLWFRFEAAADELRALREAAYFDAGVEHGITSARVHGMTGARKTARTLAQRIVQEVLRTGVARGEAVEAAVLAAWAVHRTKGPRSRSPNRMRAIRKPRA